MSKFYDKHNNPIFTVPKKDRSGLRKVTIRDARKSDWVASTTTILGILAKGEGLTIWKINQHLDAAKGLGDMLSMNYPKFRAEVIKRAQKAMSVGSDRGTAIHGAIEHYFRLQMKGADLSALSDYPKDIQPYLAALHYFVTEHKIKAQKLEEKVRVGAARTVGTCDFIGSMDGALTLIDWKCKKSVYYDPSYPMQLACYWKGLGSKGKLCSVILSTADHEDYNVSTGDLPPIEFQFWDSPLQHFKMFKTISDIYYYLNNWPAAKKGK